ncbi:MAG: DNA mismatch repair endonuclease MutL [Oscillospiraceae bacterium]|nr:DNA mismatch repair endonuclease MutL [Oscillospiraceae bacterium]
MAIIKQLDPHVADLIAAGEVVERPASVVKELIENALDAGAAAITLEIQGGGLTYIRVTDNGKGMVPADAKLAFLRYATSKLRTGRDLEAIATLGFRGEALAAISAVSRIDLLTRAEGSDEGTSVTVEAGQVAAADAAGCPVGTTMIVRDLFFNTPARLKFMKTDRAEAAAVTAMLVGVALSNPGVSFRYIRDGKEEYHTPGDGSLRSAVYTLLGRDFAKGLIEVESRGEAAEVTGFVTAPAHARGSRGHQRFYVNGRLVRSKLLQAALEQAYKNVQFSGKFPGCVLYITLGLGAVDVNVHPAKTEVKFVDEKQVFDGVYYGVLHALEQSSYMPEIVLSKDTQKVLDVPAAPAGGGVPDASRPNTAMPRGVEDAAPCKGRAEQPLYRQDTGDYPLPFAADGSELRDAIAVIYGGREAVTEPAPEQVRLTAPQESGRQGAAPTAAERRDEDITPYRVLGEALGTYILVERGEELLFIDKHAAHERILFDRLKAADYAAMPQPLIAPVTVDLGAELTAVLTERAAVLERFGFELDALGPGTVAVRQVPEEIDLDEMEPFLTELAEGLGMGRTPDFAGVRDEVLHTMACKAAIKAGRRSEPEELAALAERVLRGEVQYCPHGRPVTLTLSRAQLDKQVRRSN